MLLKFASVCVAISESFHLLGCQRDAVRSRVLVMFDGVCRHSFSCVRVSLYIFTTLPFNSALLERKLPRRLTVTEWSVGKAFALDDRT